MAVVLMLISQLLHSNRSTCHNMKLFEAKHFGNWLTRYRWSLNELCTFSYHKYCIYYIRSITYSLTLLRNGQLYHIWFECCLQ
jgi:hypothetical protein